MSTMIIYASKHGTTEDCAKSLAKKMGDDVQLVNAKKDKIPCLQCPDTIIVGGPVYAGRLPKEITKFIQANEELLMKKKLGLFMCGLADTEKETQEQFERIFPEKLRQHAVAVENFGGEINWDKLGFLEKTAIKMVTKESGTRSNLHPEAIERMAAVFK